MELEIKAKHAQNANFASTPCILEAALAEHFPDSEIYELVYSVEVDGRKYRHEKYVHRMSLEDIELGSVATDPEQVLRVIKIEGLMKFKNFKK